MKSRDGLVGSVYQFVVVEVTGRCLSTRSHAQSIFVVASVVVIDGRGHVGLEIDERLGSVGLVARVDELASTWQVTTECAQVNALFLRLRCREPKEVLETGLVHTLVL